jgi:hypothetical protein
VPPLNSWIYVGVLLAFMAVGGVSYWKGSLDGANGVKADLADNYAEQLKKFSEDAVKAAAAATAEALKDQTARLAILDQLAEDFRKARGVMYAASDRLAASLKGGACVLTPPQRQLLECVRRPSSAGCSAPAVPPG